MRVRKLGYLLMIVISEGYELNTRLQQNKINVANTIIW